jgi:hypothetical protein
MSVLSDGAFKLFVWLCLEADRRSGSIKATQRELARAVGKSRRAVGGYVRELEAKGICKVEPGTNQYGPTCFQVTDEYWPYHRAGGSQLDQHEASPARQASLPSGCEIREPREPYTGSSDYLEQVRRSFLGLGCTTESFGESDEQLARELHRRGVTIEVVEDALLLGAVRKHISWLNNGESAPIGSLKYFEGLVREVSEQTWPRGYREYLRQKKAKLAEIWKVEGRSKRAINSSEQSDGRSGRRASAGAKR